MENYVNCPKDKYHDYKVLRSPYTSNSSMQIEVCKLCGLESRYKFKKDGRMVNERQYFLDHIRAFAQQSTTDLAMDAAWVYCNPRTVRRLLEEKEKESKSAVLQAELTEKHKFFWQKALNRENWKDIGSDGVDRSYKGF